MREVMSIAGWVVAAILAFMFVDIARPLVRQIPVVGDFLGDSCELSVVAAFGLIFVVALVVVSLFTPLFSALSSGAHWQNLWRPARRVLYRDCFFVYDMVITTQDIAMVDQSRSAAVFSRFTDNIQDQNPEEALGWITRQYETLIGTCDQ